MGRHRTQEEKRELGELARELRAAGRSRREIQAELDIGDDLTTQLLAGTQVPDTLRRPRAKDDARKVARQLRVAGGTYDAIALELGVSKSTLSLWLRDLPHPSGSVAAVQGPATSGPQHDVDSRRQTARELRERGLLLKEITEQLEVSFKTVSLYVRAMPWVARSRHGRGPDHVRAMAEARWAMLRRARARRGCAAAEAGRCA